jgi:hypothetical protein
VALQQIAFKSIMYRRRLLFGSLYQYRDKIDDTSLVNCVVICFYILPHVKFMLCFPIPSVRN